MLSKKSSAMRANCVQRKEVVPDDAKSDSKSSRSARLVLLSPPIWLVVTMVAVRARNRSDDPIPSLILSGPVQDLRQ